MSYQTLKIGPEMASWTFGHFNRVKYPVAQEDFVKLLNACTIDCVTNNSVGLVEENQMLHNIRIWELIFYWQKNVKNNSDMYCTIKM
jgi:hypothetical protein